MQEGVSSPGQSYGSESGPEGSRAQLQTTQLVTGLEEGPLQPSDFYPTEYCLSAGPRDHAAPSHLTACAAVTYPTLCSAKLSPSMRSPSSLFWGAHIHTSGLDK